MVSKSWSISLPSYIKRVEASESFIASFRRRTQTWGPLIASAIKTRGGSASLPSVDALWSWPRFLHVSWTPLPTPSLHVSPVVGVNCPVLLSSSWYAAYTICRNLVISFAVSLQLSSYRNVSLHMVEEPNTEGQGESLLSAFFMIFVLVDSATAYADLNFLILP